MVTNVQLNSPSHLLLAKNSSISVQVNFREGLVRKQHSPRHPRPDPRTTIFADSSPYSCSVLLCMWFVREPRDAGLFALSLLPMEPREEEGRVCSLR